MTTIGGNPSVEGSLNLSDEVVTDAQWKSSSNATPQDIDKIILDGSVIWERPNYEMTVTIAATPDTNASGHILLTVSAPEQIDSWKYRLGLVGELSASQTGTSIELPYDEFTSPYRPETTTVYVFGYRNGEERAQAQDTIEDVVPHKINIIRVITDDVNSTINMEVEIDVVDVNEETVWEYKLDDGPWVVGGSIKSGRVLGDAYYKLASSAAATDQPLSVVPEVEHKIQTRYKGVRNGEEYILDESYFKFFTIESPASITLIGDSAVSKTAQEVQVAGDSLVYSGLVPMGTEVSSDANERDNKQFHTFVGGGGVTTVWNRGTGAEGLGTGGRRWEQWNIIPQATTQEGITWNGEVSRLWVSRSANWKQGSWPYREYNGGNRFIESPAGYLYAAGSNIFGELGTKTSWQSVTADSTWEDLIYDRPQNFVALLAKYYKRHDYGVLATEEKYRIVYQMDPQGNVSPISDIKEVYVSHCEGVLSRQTYILKNDGTVWASGGNYFGELGSHQTDPNDNAGQNIPGYGYLDYPGGIGGYLSDTGDGYATGNRLRIRNIFCQVMTTDADDVPNLLRGYDGYPKGTKWKLGPFVYESTEGGCYWQGGYNGPGGHGDEYPLTSQNYQVTGQPHRMNFKFIRNHLSPLTGVKDIVNHRNGAWFLKTDGTMFSIGSAYTSMLGTGHMIKDSGGYSKYAYNPRMDSVSGPDDLWVDVVDAASAGLNHSYEYKYTQGSAYARQMYHGTTTGRETWTRGNAITGVKQISGVANFIESQNQAPSNLHEAFCIGSIGVMVMNNGTVYGMGRDGARALGGGFPNTYYAYIYRASTMTWGTAAAESTDISCRSAEYNASVYPVQLKATSSTNLTGVSEAHVSLTGEQTFFIMNDGRLKVLGANTFGEAGTNSGTTEVIDKTFIDETPWVSGSGHTSNEARAVVENDDYCGVRYNRLAFCYASSSTSSYKNYRYAQNIPHVILWPRYVKKFSKTNPLTLNEGPLCRNVLTAENAVGYEPEVIGITNCTVVGSRRTFNNTGAVNNDTNSYKIKYVTDSQATDIENVISLKFLSRKRGCQILTSDGKAYSLDVLGGNYQAGADMPANMVAAGLVHTGQEEFETYMADTYTWLDSYYDTSGSVVGSGGDGSYYFQYVYKLACYGCAIEVDLSAILREGYTDEGAEALSNGERYDELISKTIKKNGATIQTIPAGGHTNPWYASVINNPGVYTINFDFTRNGNIAPTVTRTVTITTE
jgi:hypothetical protein